MAGSCLFFGPAQGERKAPSYGNPFPSPCILRLHPPDYLLQAKVWLKQGRPHHRVIQKFFRMVNHGLSSARRWSAMQDLPPDFLSAPVWSFLFISKIIKCSRETTCLIRLLHCNMKPTFKYEARVLS